MKCGQGIIVKDFWGAYRVRFIAQCEGRFLMISSDITDGRNGYLLPGWQAVLREMVALTVPARLLERTRTVEATAPDGLYLNFPLTYPLSSVLFGRLFGEPADLVRAELADMAVSHDEM